MITPHIGPPEFFISAAALTATSAATYGVGIAYCPTGAYFSSGSAWTEITDAGDSAINAVITGYTSGAGVVAATDTILEAIQKLNGNIAAKADPVAAADGDFYVSVTSGGAVTTKLTFTNGILTAITPPA